MLEPIPEDFQKESGTFFQSCMMCDCKLQDHPQGYFIEKAIKKYPEFDSTQELFAYAICYSCAHKMHQKLSVESRAKVKAFMMQCLTNNNIPKDLQRCSLTGDLASEMKEYQIQVFCMGDKMVPNHGPMLIGEIAIEEIAGLLSDKSWEELDNFTDTFFGLPPAFRKAIKDRDYIII